MATPAKKKMAARKPAAKRKPVAKAARLKERLEESGSLERIDLSVAAAATKAGRKKPARVAVNLAEIAARPPLMAAAMAVAGVGLMRRDRKMKRAGLRMLLAVTLATGAARMGKKAISRSRPGVLVDRGKHKMKLGGPDEDAWNSFPSAHAAGGFAAARALGRDYPMFSPQAVSAAVAAGALKVLKGDHFPSDIIAGLAIGAAAEGIANAVVPAAEDDPE